MLPASELILNPDGSVYHLNLRPEQLADTILTVGDPVRVRRITARFDRIDAEVAHREFLTQTGELNGQRLSVISTGIGTDNVDIVLNELDALVNIDLTTRRVRPEKRTLRLLRVGTSGALRSELPLDSFLLSTYAIGLDNLLHFYPDAPRPAALQSAAATHLPLPVRPYATAAAPYWTERFSPALQRGITLTCPGFYAPQGRVLRLRTPLDEGFFDAARTFTFNGLRITNFEMETAGLLGLATALGHEAGSCSVLLANRATGEFSADPAAAVERLIDVVLETVTA